jgi:hypothetical protein
MTALLVVALLAAPPVAAPGAAAFERVKKLEGNWKSKDGSTLSVRVTASGTAVVGSLTGGDHALVSVTVFRVEAGELQAAFDGRGHGALRHQSATEQVVRLEARPDGAKAPVMTLSLAIKDAENFTWSVTTRTGPKDEEESIDFTREYVETLK